MQLSYSPIRQHVNKHSLFLSNHHLSLYSNNIAIGTSKFYSGVLAEMKTCKLNSPNTVVQYRADLSRHINSLSSLNSVVKWMNK